MNTLIRIILGSVLTLGAARAETASFRNDILPILARAGCANGSCHAKQGGQNGFQLSIFAYDPKEDYRQIVHEARGRRIFPAAPEESLLLLKATQEIDHEGGKRFEKESEFYRALHAWIGQGAPWSGTNEPILSHIKVEPGEGQYQKGTEQQLKVTAVFSDQSERDVTHLSEYQSNDQSIATVDHDGNVVVGGISGEAVIVARYMDKVEVSRLAVPSDKRLPAEIYDKLVSYNEIDRLVHERHRQLGLLASDTCSDAEFIRRVSLDALGKLPKPERIRMFLKDKDPGKRDKLVDEMLSDPDWADFWAIKWGDLLRPNTRHVGVKPVMLMDRWIRRKLRTDTRYDDFVRELLTATGSTHEVGPVALLRDKRDPKFLGAFVSRAFMGVRLECAQCHHHPSEKWGQDDYYQMAAFFGSMKRKGQGISAPISGEPEYWWWQPGGTVKHPVTGEVMSPKPPDGPLTKIPADKDPREALVDWLVQPDNPFFAQATVNRLWGELFGKGIVEPVDDFRASNPPSNAPLLDWLAKDFIRHKFDLKHTIGLILKSRTYQSSSLANETNVGDDRNFARSYRRRLPAEVMADALTHVTGIPDYMEGLANGSSAMQNWNRTMASTLMDTFGRPDASAECPCERDPDPTIVQSLHLMNSSKLEDRIANSKGTAAELAKGNKSPGEIVEEIYLLAYARLPSPEEKNIATALFGDEKAEPADRKKAAEDLIWALLNTPEFVLNH